MESACPPRALSQLLRPICAIAAAVAIAALAGCVTAPEAPKTPQVPVPTVVIPPLPPANHPLLADDPSFVRLANIPPGKTPVRVGLLLPFSNGSGATRVLANSMMKAAELALFDANNPDMILISADEGSTPDTAANGARALLAQGAEVIVGPLFSGSVTAVAPIARDRAVPVISFSSDRSVAGQGVYLLSFQPENEVRRVVGFAATRGHKNFSALVPNSPYGDHISDSLKAAVADAGAQVVDIERFDPASEADAVKKIAAANADAVLIAAGGASLRELGPMLVAAGVDKSRVQFLGPGVWDDPSITKESMLEGGWFGAPPPDSDAAFNEKYRSAYGGNPPQLATLAYDAVSLIALLAAGEPYHRFTPAALVDPNGFAGVDGIFRFNADGSSDRGIAILSVEPDGFRMVDPPPHTFEKPVAETPAPKPQS